MKPFLEDIGIGSNQSILAFKYVKEHFETPWHFHPQHELTYISDSSGTKFIGDFVGSYAPGELVLLKSQLPHCWKNEVNPNALSKSTVIQWNPGIFGQVSELSSVDEMMNLAARGLLFDKKQVEEIVPFVLNLPNIKGSELYVNLLSVLISLSKCTFQVLSTSQYNDGISTQFSSRISIIQDFVRSSYHRKIYLSEPAMLIGLTEQSFSRFFKKAMGRPFFTYLNEYRINIACKMLTESDWPISRIAYSCGYESMPFLHRQFKKFTGNTPLKYRQKYASM